LVHSPLNNCVRSPPLCLHAYMGIVLDHVPTDVACNSHKSLFAGLGLRELRNTSVAQIVKAQLQPGTPEGSTPSGAPGRYWPRRVNALTVGVFPFNARRLTRGEDIIFRIRLD
jgi:hypothetical protein